MTNPETIEEEPKMADTARVYEKDDLVELRSTSELFNVDAFFPGNQYRAPQLTLSRTYDLPNGAGAVVTDVAPENVRLVTRWAERAMFPGDGWSQ